MRYDGEQIIISPLTGIWGEVLENITRARTNPREQLDNERAQDILMRRIPNEGFIPGDGYTDQLRRFATREGGTLSVSIRRCSE